MARRRRNSTLFDVMTAAQSREPIRVQREPARARPSRPAATSTPGGIRHRLGHWLLGNDQPIDMPVETSAGSDALESLRRELRQASEPAPEADPVEPKPSRVQIGMDRLSAAIPSKRLVENARQPVMIVMGLLILFALAFFVGRMLAPEAPLASQMTPQPQVMLQQSTPAIVPSVTPAPATVAPQPVAAAPAPVARQAGMNYVIIQSYPTEQQAQAAVEVLASFKIGATVELNLPRWARPGSTLYSVVGTDGFERLSSNPAYTRYIEAVRRVSSQEFNRTLDKRLDPHAYRWPESR
jgi:hypothetical protein